MSSCSKLGLTSSERVLGQAVGSAAKAAGCLQRYYCIFEYIQIDELSRNSGQARSTDVGLKHLKHIQFLSGSDR